MKKPESRRPEAVGRDADTARRLRHLRETLGYNTAKSFAEFLGLGNQRWNNVENGAPLSKEIGFKLVQKVPGLTLDWLYFGKPDGLPLELARSLGAFSTNAKNIHKR